MRNWIGSSRLIVRLGTSGGGAGNGLARFNTATAEVALEGEPTVAVVAAATAHAAAGIHVLVAGVMTPALGLSTLDVVVRAIVIGEVPPMQIGVTPIGGGKIGP